MNSGPELELLTRRMAECPAEFSRTPGHKAGQVDVEAVVGDLLRDLGLDWVAPEDTAVFAERFPRQALELVLLGCWLLHE